MSFSCATVQAILDITTVNPTFEMVEEKDSHSFLIRPTSNTMLDVSLICLLMMEFLVVWILIRPTA